MFKFQIGDLVKINKDFAELVFQGDQRERTYIIQDRKWGYELANGDRICKYRVRAEGEVEDHKWRNIVWIEEVRFLPFELELQPKQPDVLMYKDKEVKVGGYLASADSYYIIREFGMPDRFYPKGWVRVAASGCTIDEETGEYVSAIREYEPRYEIGIFNNTDIPIVPGEYFEHADAQFIVYRIDNSIPEIQAVCLNAKEGSRWDNLVGEICYFSFKDKIKKIDKNAIIKPKAKRVVQIDMADVQKQLQELLPEARDEIEDIDSGTASFHVFYANKEGKVGFYGGDDQPCHWDLKMKQSFGYDVPKGSIAVAVVDYVGERIDLAIENGYTGAKAMAEWIIKHSPWSKVYEGNDFDKAYKDGLRLNIERSGNEVASACIALRQTHEFPESTSAFPALIEKGYDGSVAWLLSFFFSVNNGVWKYTPIDGGGHSCMDGKAPVEKVFNFLANGLPEKPVESYKDNPTYTDVYGVIGRYNYREEEDSIQDWIRKNIKMKEVGQGFARKKVIEEESIFKLADAISAQIKEYKNA